MFLRPALLLFSLFGLTRSIALPFQIDPSLEGLPIIRNYMPREYRASAQNWAIVQDLRGMIFAGNSNGLLEYDGGDWRLHPVPNDVVRSLALGPRGEVLIGGVNEIGTFAYDSTGSGRYVSLVSSIPSADREFDDVWSLFVVDSLLYAQSFSTILVFSITEHASGEPIRHLKTYKTAERFFPLCQVGGRIYTTIRNAGLFVVTEDSLEPVPGGEMFSRDVVFVMLPGPNRQSGRQALVGTLRNGLYLFDGRTFERFTTEADRFLETNRLYHRGAQLPDGSYALGTQLGGVAVLDRNGSVRKIIDKESGLPNQTVWYTFCDREGNLWLGLDNGISKVIPPFANSVFDQSTGLDGKISSLFQSALGVYAATASGIFKQVPSQSPGVPSSFKRVLGINVQSWGLIDTGDDLLAATNDGIYAVSGSSAVMVAPTLSYALSLHHSRHDPSEIYVGRHVGLSLLRRTEIGWTDAGPIAGVAGPVEMIEEGPVGIIWTASGTSGLFRIDDSKRSEPDVRKVAGTENLKITGIRYIPEKDQILCGTTRGFRLVDASSGAMIPGETLPQWLGDDDVNVRAMADGPTGDLWIILSRGETLTIGIVDGISSGISLSPVSSYLESILDQTPSFTDYSLAPGSDVTWISAGESAVRFAVGAAINPADQPHQAFIRRIVTGEQVLYGGGSRTAHSVPDVELTAEGSILFEYATPVFINEDKTEYRYLLEGFSRDWSPWERTRRKEYISLSPGDYRFQVQSRSASGTVSKEAIVAFTVPRPWYLSTWAILGYSLMGLVVLIGAVQIRVRMLTRQTRTLEATVDERTKEVVEQKKKLEDQAARLVELDHLKSRFFANISHEFRTPLTLILGELDTVMSKMSAGEIREKLTTAVRNARRLQRLINQLLEIARLESGKSRIRAVETDIVQLVRSRFFSFESLAEQKKIRLQFDHSAEIINVYIDREKFGEIVDNLLSNAVKFTKPGGLISINLETDPAGLLAHMTVRDTGIGIEEEQLPYIFDRFHQTDASQTREYEGTGLGLSIVQELVHLHKGTIDVRSTVGKGTEFRVELRLGRTHLGDDELADAVAMTEQGSKVIEMEAPSRPVSGPGERIARDTRPVVLVVEDNDDMQQYIREQLEEQYAVVLAANGEEGLALASSLIPDLIITDVMMPRMDGLALSRALRSDLRTSHIPLILLTARATEEGKIEGLEAGAEDYLIKPFSTRELKVRVQNLIKMRTLLRDRFKTITVVDPKEVTEKSIDQRFLENVFSIIREHVEDPQFSVQSLSDEVSMSVSQLNRKLNAMLGQSAGKLIRSTRLEYAAGLLRQKAGTVTEIAFRVGFSDHASFTRSFKERFSQSPTAYSRLDTE